MKFCHVCDNMLYVKTEDNMQLINYCKNCNHWAIEDPSNLAMPLTDSGQLLDSKKKELENLMDPSIKYDPTLPRVSNIVCKNPSCTKKPEEANEIIYIKHDPENMNFLYFCCKCEAFF